MLSKKEILAKAREERKRPPAPDHRCECKQHEKNLHVADLYPEAGASRLKKVYLETSSKLCFEWWCGVCFEAEEVGEFESGWPVGDDGKFMTPVRCDTIPGLD